MVMSTCAGLCWLRKLIGVPHRAQKCRSACAEEAYARGSPAVMVRRSAAKVAHATIGAPLARWQMRQWQYPQSTGSPLTL